MCTVTYLPKGKNHFLFTSNRDEAPSRTASGITKTQSGQKSLLFPRDKGAQGTWIAVSDSNQLVCILNGAFEKHKHRPPYRLSRGIMAIQFFEHTHMHHFVDAFDFEGIEPFTMIVFDDGQLYELRWDEQAYHLQRLDISSPHIWASSTLYTPLYKQKRSQWFAEWRARQSNYTQEEVLDFHQTAGEGDSWNDLVMNRAGQVRTVSITAVEKFPDQIHMKYINLLNNASEQAQLAFKSSQQA